MNNFLTKREYGIATAIFITFIIAVIKITPVGEAYAPKDFTPSKAYVKEVLVTPTPPIKNPSSEQEQIVMYIREVFGADSDKAFKLLSCENKRLNPNAININTDSHRSRDLGVFQINEYWQRTQGKFLLNWKINIEVAHQLYVENGDFHLWTCGRKFGI